MKLRISSRLQIGRVSVPLGIATLVLLLVFSLPMLNIYIRGDSILYYAYVRSLVIDGDLDFENEYLYSLQVRYDSPPLLSGEEDFEPTPYNFPSLFLARGRTRTGYYGNQMVVGPSLLWTPFFLLGHGLAYILNWTGINTVPLDGFSWPYLFFTALGSLLYGFSGLLLAYSIARSYFSEWVCVGAVVLIWFGSAIPAYTYGMPVQANGPSVFMTSLFLWCFLRWQQELTVRRCAVLGLIGGLMLVVRLQDGLVWLVPVGYALNQFVGLIRGRQFKQLGPWLGRYVIVLTSAVVGLLPQLAVTSIIYGQPSLSGYEPMYWAFPPPLGEFLFSSRSGFISTHPVLLVAGVGLVWLIKRDRVLGVLLGALLLVQTIIMSGLYFVGTNWYINKASFGSRIMIDLTFVYVVGLAAAIDWLLRKRVPRWAVFIVGGAVIAWNFGFLIQYGLGLIPRQDYFSWSLLVYNQFFVVPGLLLRVIIRAIGGSRYLICGMVLAAIGLLGYAGWLRYGRYHAKSIPHVSGKPSDEREIYDDCVDQS